MSNNKSIGNKGEALACAYLIKRGYRILARNYLIRGGEIDIVAIDQEFLVFIEVKTRYSHEYGLPIEAMTPGKIKALLKTAMFYLQSRGWSNKAYRIDFVGVDFTNSSEDPEIELVKNIVD